MATLLIPWLLHFHLWFGYAVYRKRNDIADVAWGLGILVVALAQLIQAKAFDTRHLLIFFLVFVWAVRLSAFIFSRGHSSDQEDPRYQEMRKNWGQGQIAKTYFYIFWLQAILQLAIASPAILLLRDSQRIVLFDLVPTALALLGIGIEAVADYQKSEFRKNPHHRGQFIQSGLWKYSRHPNYFGEILFWFGLASFSWPSLSWAWAGPTLLTVLLLKVSGVPLLEKKYAGNAAYAAYKQRTRVLLPVPKLGGFK